MCKCDIIHVDFISNIHVYKTVYNVCITWYNYAFSMCILYGTVLGYKRARVCVCVGGGYVRTYFVERVVE